ncbi:YeeE/YedE family protein [Streptomyces acidiscabies]|uniref:YeeE/YedE thiosulfate transporter family protein n=1 Tax=Streptomyces acidiscabies TaxID=42234 RepID=A0AAP6EDX5_9ACTN|nr:YeeE/YedE thiosulfate transporter family protein [Streptomyces acidiscabies]MBP5939786.1 transporter [Streptomyces sp. LBUM 1476]MBZ3910967.1 YeeE/YedE family protein [Streptomyces acidiscabies]MDX2959253.1 YeeE/YedE thiosulfate transporter family protein [Streptomyces acidiscabies]MDX3017603.1 YeeE/YedE thiosulfate transporter family protein [Streptomyces acidiscabies]MDX3788078.1 YeeE/YedE thiosulfate transporter family protein [Streptomyces acidiscabies]
MSAYWPWWAGAIGLAVLTIGYTLATDRSFGVSGAWERVLHWRREAELERVEAEFADERVLAAALAVATAEHFGTVPVAPGSGSGSGSGSTMPEPSTAVLDKDVPGQGVPGKGERRPPRPAPLVTQAVLLASVFVGGLIAAVTSGRFHLRLDMGAGYRDVVTGNPVVMVVLLFVGGVLVGFGTRLAGGCSSGHGLNGCGRLSPVSLVATATFCATAVVVSFLLWKVI